MRTEPITCSNPSYKCFTIRCIISSIIRTKIPHYRHPYNTQSVAQSNVRFIVFSFASVYGYVVCMCVYNASLPLLCLIYTCISTELDRAVRAFNRVLHLGLINRVCAHREFKCISSNQIRKRFERAFVLNVVCASAILAASLGGPNNYCACCIIRINSATNNANRMKFMRYVTLFFMRARCGPNDYAMTL